MGGSCRRRRAPGKPVLRRTPEPDRNLQSGKPAPTRIGRGRRASLAQAPPESRWQLGLLDFSINCDAARGAACTGRGSRDLRRGRDRSRAPRVPRRRKRQPVPRPLPRHRSQRPQVPEEHPGRAGLLRPDERQPPHLFPRLRDDRDVRGLCVDEAAAVAEVGASRPSSTSTPCQNPYKAWRYGKRPGDNDASVTGWMLMALKAAKDAGIPVNDRTMKDGLAFIDSAHRRGHRPHRLHQEGRAARPARGTQRRSGPRPSPRRSPPSRCAARIFCDAADSR